MALKVSFKTAYGSISPLGASSASSSSVPIVERSFILPYRVFLHGLSIITTKDFSLFFL